MDNKQLFIVILSRKNAWQAHSIHSDRAKADAFVECKQDDGEDASICVVSLDLLIDSCYKNSPQ